MSVRTSKSPLTCLVSCCALCAAILLATPAQAEESIIRRPGDHPNYGFEVEPHLLAAFLLTRAGEGFGLGGRFTIPIVKNGFVSSINNSVGIGFGLDWAHYNGCYYYYYFDPAFGSACPSINTFVVPVVMQWNFFLSKHWSVFGEPGLALEYTSWGSCPGYYVDPQGRVHNYLCPIGPNHVTFDPFILFVGGRYQFSDGVALTMRVGWPYFSIGVSFFP
jgi:hypothetical protein